MSTAEKAMSLREAREIAADIIGKLAPFCERIKVAGSIRRGKQWINDVEIVAIPKSSITDPEFDLFGNKTGGGTTVRDPGFVEAVAKMTHQHIKGSALDGRYMQFLTDGLVKVDLFTAVRGNWGYILAIRTGSADFSKMIASRWVSLGYNGQDGFLVRSGQRCNFPEERDLFDALGLHTPPPPDREMTANGLQPWIIA